MSMHNFSRKKPHRNPNTICKFQFDNNVPIKGACYDHFFTALTHLNFVEIIIFYERPYFSHQHTEILRSKRSKILIRVFYIGELLVITL